MSQNRLFSSDFTLGILGGGQLGKMLLYTTRKWDIKTFVMDPSDEAPCKIACDKFFIGDLMNYEDVYAFGKSVDLLTIEIEHINIDALKQLQEEGLEIHPKPQVLELIKNKGRQKKFYSENGIATSAFNSYETLDDLLKAVENKAQKLPFVWKSTEFGYDGNGVWIVKEESDLANLKEGECIAEEFVDFKNELAVIVSTSSNGESITYPVVEMEFHPTANQVEYVLCPARISDDIADKARDLALKTADKMGATGLLAVEMFLTKDDEILINEVAPRPHNSGHYSIEASITSQYEQHIRAILGLPLGATQSKTSAVMVNLVGDENYTGEVVYQGIEDILCMNGVTPHIYGKKETRPFRKMGHVTIVDNNIDKAREVAESVKNTIKVISI
jgi:5-(carboxyamino)imidazole ribonucleotide synthase